MSRHAPEPVVLETDPRFPSGEWRGFFQQPKDRRHDMELLLTFRDGRMTGEGRDRIGHFHVNGKYDVDDGRCRWTKQYVKKHAVAYDGYNEGKGIWGVWRYREGSWSISAGFHIWPVGMGDPTGEKLAAEAEEPVLVGASVTEDPWADSGVETVDDSRDLSRDR